jgi:hypothetical protein
MGGLEESKKGERREHYLDSSCISMKEYDRRSLLLQHIRAPTDGIVIEGLDLLNKHEAEEDTLSLDSDSSASFANNSLTMNRKRLPSRAVRVRRRRPKPNRAMRRASTGSNMAEKMKTAEVEQESQLKMNGGLSKLSRRRFSNCAA